MGIDKPLRSCYRRGVSDILRIKKTKRVMLGITAVLIILALFLGGCGTKPLDDAQPSETTPSVLWLNGTHAVLTKVNYGDVYLFGGMALNNRNRQMTLIALDRWWGVTDKAEMDEMIDLLVNGRHNTAFLEEIEETNIIYMNKSEFDEALKEVTDRLDVIYYQNMFDAYQSFGENAILGWDLSRAVQLCADGYVAGFYSYEEATDKARIIGEKIQNIFDSWDDFYASYFYGYAYWSEDDKEDEKSGYAERIIIFEELKKDENGPLNLDWRLDLLAQTDGALDLSAQTDGVNGTKRVGSDAYGYISIPNSWVNFQDLSPMPGAIQYTNGGGAIITMNLFDADLNVKPQDALANLVAYHENQGAVGMEGAMVTLNGETVHQIYGYYPFDNTFIVIWMFEGPEGNVHYISAEAPENTIMETVEIVEATFSFDN